MSTTRTAQLASAIARSARGRALFGWVAPTDIYAKMRQLDAAVEVLHMQILANVADSVFQAGWAAWRADWKRYFQATTSLSQKVPNAFHTDTIAAQVDSYARQYSNADGTGWREAYAQQKNAKGDPVPAPVAPAAPGPIAPGSPSAEPGFLARVPWWGWVLGTVATGATGWLAYTIYGRAKVASRQAYKDVDFLRGGVRKRLGLPPMTAERSEPPALAVVPAAKIGTCGCHGSES